MAAGDATGTKQVFKTNLTDTDSRDLEGIGTIRREPDGKEYKWVRYREGTAALDIVAGDPLGYYTDGSDGDVTADASDTDGVFAGVAMAAVTVDNIYMWIQTKGIATLSSALTAGSVGNAIKYNTGADKKMTVAAAVTDQISGAYVNSSGPKVLLYGTGSAN